ncbi:MAG: four helix bundle protein [Candidatus Moraniibacteriota bacterium]
MEEKAKIKSFTDLYAWQEGHKLVLMIYGVTKSFPREELFGLVSQMRRAAISITSNVAEGFSRSTAKDKCQFYSIAHGSLTELQNQLIVGRDIGHINKEEFNKIANQTIIVHKLITGLKKIKNFNT